MEQHLPLRTFIISQSVYLWQAFPAQSNDCGAYPRVEHLQGASLRQAPALPTIIRLGWKGLPETNTLAYYESLQRQMLCHLINLTFPLCATGSGQIQTIKFMIICQRISTFFIQSLITVSTIEKVSQFTMAMQSICNKKMFLFNQNLFVNIAERFKHQKYLCLYY